MDSKIKDMRYFVMNKEKVIDNIWQVLSVIEHSNQRRLSPREGSRSVPQGVNKVPHLRPNCQATGTGTWDRIENRIENREYPSPSAL